MKTFTESIVKGHISKKEVKNVFLIGNTCLYLFITKFHMNFIIGKILEYNEDNGNGTSRIKFEILYSMFSNIPPTITRSLLSKDKNLNILYDNTPIGYYIIIDQKDSLNILNYILNKTNKTSDLTKYILKAMDKFNLEIKLEESEYNICKKILSQE